MLRIITRETKLKFQVTIGVFSIAFVMSVIETFTEYFRGVIGLLRPGGPVTLIPGYAGEG